MLMFASLLGCATPATTPSPSLSVEIESERVVVRLGDRELTAYQHGPRFAIPHFFPLTSPSGQQLVSQHPEPYPHHRALWIVDKVQLGDGPVVDYYHHWSNYLDPDQPELGHRHLIRHDAVTRAAVEDGVARVAARLTWVTDAVSPDGTMDAAVGTPVLDQLLELRVRDLGNGEALLDLEWSLTASHGPVHFKSDWVHYAWPYLRIAPPFAGDAGGVLLSDSGARGQAETNEQPAHWIDYSNTVDGRTEGVAVFVVPGPAGELPRWLTREYGTFGPRRLDALSGTDFTLPEGETLSGHAGIYVHSGDAAAAGVAARYAGYLDWVDAPTPPADPSLTRGLSRDERDA